MAIKDFLFGGSPEVERVQRQQLRDYQSVMDQSRRDFQQEQAYGAGNRQLKQGYLESLFSDRPEDVAKYNEPYMRSYQEQILPKVTEAAGAYGGFRSTGYQNAILQSGEAFGENLAAMRNRERGGALSALTADYDNAFNRYRQMATQPLDVSQYGGTGFVGGALNLLQQSGVMGNLGNRAVDYLGNMLFGGRNTPQIGSAPVMGRTPGQASLLQPNQVVGGSISTLYSPTMMPGSNKFSPYGGR